MPIWKFPYYYYEKTLEGKEYVQHCRRTKSNDDGVQLLPSSIYAIKPIGDGEYLIERVHARSLALPRVKDVPLDKWTHLGDFPKAKPSQTNREYSPKGSASER